MSFVSFLAREILQCPLRADLTGFWQGGENEYEFNQGFETGPNGHRTLVCTPKLDK